MTQTVVIACIETRNPPNHLKAFDGLDVSVHRVVGFGQPEEARALRDGGKARSIAVLKQALNSD